MLTEYNGNIYNAEINGDLVNIWKYVPVHEFEKKRTRRGVTYYEKNVKTDEVSPFFSVLFKVYHDGKTFVINSLEKDYLDLLCDDEIYAKSHGFVEIERGVWETRLPIEMFSEIIMLKKFEGSNENEIKNIPAVDFEKTWNRYVKDVNINQ